MKRNKWITAVAVGAALTVVGAAADASQPEVGIGIKTPDSAQEQDFSDSVAGFVSLAEAVPDVILEIRYYSSYNFVGERIDGYEDPCALITKEAAKALKGAAADAQEQGYMLKIYDAYRPQMAVDHFIAWAEDTADTDMKEYFYPELDKSVLFEQGYIAEKSGHSRGSTVDLTLFDMDTGKELDMGGTFDYFGELSHPDYTGDLTQEQIQNRNTLRDIMVENGFKPLDTEWWHFTLEDEPYPDTYFTFPVEEDLVSAPQTDGAQNTGQTDVTQSAGQADGQTDGTQSAGQADGQTDGTQSAGQADGQTDGTQSAGQADGQTNSAQSAGQADTPQTEDQQDMARCPFCGEWFSTADKGDGSLNDYRFHTQVEIENGAGIAQCSVCGEWFSTEEIDGQPSEYTLHEIDEMEMSWIPESTENMVQCQFCGGWYEEGNVFRNHICPGRDEAYAPEE